jgi:hypothetical protein
VTQNHPTMEKFEIRVASLADVDSIVGYNVAMAQVMIQSVEVCDTDKTRLQAQLVLSVSCVIA